MTLTSRWISFASCLLLSSCGAAQHGPVVPETMTPETITREEAAVAAVLDDWHAAAAASDEDRYFDHFTDDGIFMGTDATERWDAPSFRVYAHRPFSEGRGWHMRSVRRAIRIVGEVAYFDEDLETVNLGPARGTGVLLRHDGRWRIAHYSLTITVPNERFDGVRALLSREEASLEEASREDPSDVTPAVPAAVDAE